jgi:hypothetical protein
MVALVIILVLFIVYLLFLWKARPQVEPIRYKTVSAGDPNKYFSSTIDLNTNIYNINMFSDNNKKIIPENYDIYVVVGSSMKNSNIEEHDFVFVERLYGEAKYKIKKDNILLLAIDRSKDSGISDNVEFKLRKHIAYIDNSNDFDVWINNLSAENKDIFVKKEQIRAKYEDCVKKYKQHNSEENFVFTFSSTLDEVKDEVKYSFHPVKFLNGVVYYVLKNKEIRE